MKVTKTTFAGWPGYPVYKVYTRDEYSEISNWMCANEVDQFMLSSGSNGYTFQVRSKHDWFALRWS